MKTCFMFMKKSWAKLISLSNFNKPTLFGVDYGAKSDAYF